MSDLKLERAEFAGARALVVGGEVDLATAPALTSALADAIRASEGVLVVDLCDVTFLDSTGIHALLRARALLGRADRPLALVCPPGVVSRALELAGIEDMFALYEAREEAARALTLA